MNKDPFVDILRENWLHMRHQETQRMWIANIFVAIVVGTSAYLAESGLEKLPWFIPLIFFIISLFCLLVTLKLNKVFVETKKSTKSIFKDGKIYLGEQGDWRKYVGMLESTKWIWKVLRVRYLYVALYSIAILASLILLGFTLAN